jgi:hypothetical protein
MLSSQGITGDALLCFGFGVHPIFSRLDILAITIGVPNASITVLFDSPGPNLSLKNFLEDPNKRKYGLHLERTALFLYANYRYRLSPFFEINPEVHRHQSIPRLFDAESHGGYLRPEVTTDNLLADHEWLSLENVSDVGTRMQLYTTATLAEMAHFVGRITGRGGVGKMCTHEMVDKYPQLLPTWIKYARNSNIEMRSARPMTEIQCEPPVVEVYPSFD